MDFFPSNLILQTTNHNDHQPPQDFQGIGSVLGKRSMLFSGIDILHEEANSGYDEDNFSDGEKKRRLNMEQVKTLEKTFELGNKLDPERKIQLAKELGLQPRQIAIWFQNRRARWKTKQLEKDYDILKTQFDSLKAHHESLLAQNQNLQSQILTLKGRQTTKSINLNKDTDQGSCSERSENNSDIKLDMAINGGENDSPVSGHQTSNNSIAFFPSSSSSNQSRPMAQLFQSLLVKDESFTNMFCGINDQPGLWPWFDHPNFN